jgi:hypothetical protein
MEPALHGLLRVAAEISKVSAGHLERRLNGCLPVAGFRPGASTLNNDGSPLQLVLSVSRRGAKSRLLVDPALDEALPHFRLNRARRALVHSCSAWPRFRRDEIEAAVGDALPDPSSLARLSSGALWVGCGADGPDVLAYITGRWGPAAERWSRAEAWMERWSGAAAAAACRHLSTHCDLASVAVAGNGRRAAAKLYFRLRAPLPLAHLGLPGLAGMQVAQFLQVVVGDRPLRSSGLVLSFSAPFDGGRVDGCKIDVCAHCLKRRPEDWIEVLQRLAGQLDLPLPLDPPILLTKRAEVAFIGLGVGRETRLNLYLKPAAGESRTPATAC